MEPLPPLTEERKKPRLGWQATVGIWVGVIFVANLVVAGLINQRLAIFTNNSTTSYTSTYREQAGLQVSPVKLGQKILVWLGIKNEGIYDRHSAATFAPATFTPVPVKSISEHLKEVVSVTPIVTVDWQGLRSDDRVIDTVYNSAGEFVGATVERLINNQAQQFLVVDEEVHPNFDAVGPVKSALNQAHQAYLAINDESVLVVEDGQIKEPIGKVQDIQNSLKTLKDGRELLEQASEGFLGYSPEGHLMYRGFKTGTQFVVAGEQRLENVDKVEESVTTDQGELVGFVARQVLNSGSAFKRAGTSCLSSEFCKQQLSNLLPSDSNQNGTVERVVSTQGVSLPFKKIELPVSLPGTDAIGFIGELVEGKQVVIDNLSSKTFTDLKGLNLNSTGEEPVFLGKVKEAWSVYQGNEVIKDLGNLMPSDLAYDFSSNEFQVESKFGQLFSGQAGVKQLKELAPSKLLGKNPLNDAIATVNPEGLIVVRDQAEAISKFKLDDSVSVQQLLDSIDQLNFSASNRIAVPLSNNELGFEQMMSDDWLSPIFKKVSKPSFSPNGELLTYSALAHQTINDSRPVKVYLEDQLVAVFDKLVKEPTFVNEGKELLATGIIDGQLKELRVNVSETAQVMREYRTALQSAAKTIHTINLSCDDSSFYTLASDDPILGNICAVRILNGQIEYLRSQAPFLKNIQRLDLSNNGLTTLPNYLTEFKELRWIDLRGNPIKNFSLLEQLPKLEEILY